DHRDLNSFPTRRSSDLEADNLTQDEMILGDYFSDDDIPDYRLNKSERKSDTDFFEISYYDDKSLHDYLFEQIGLMDLDSEKQTRSEEHTSELQSRENLV